MEAVVEEASCYEQSVMQSSANIISSQYSKMESYINESSVSAGAKSRVFIMDVRELDSYDSDEEDA